MADLTTARITAAPTGAVKVMSFPLPAGQKAIEGTPACMDSAALGGVYPVSASTATQTAIGRFIESVDNTAGGSAVPVGVELNREIQLSYWDSVTGGNAVTSNDIFRTVYFASNHELTRASGNPAAGRVWIIRDDGQIGVEFPF